MVFETHEQPNIRTTPHHNTSPIRSKVSMPLSGWVFLTQCTLNITAIKPSNGEYTKLSSTQYLNSYQYHTVLWHCWLGDRKGIRPVKMGGRWRWALVSPDGVAPSQMVGVSASVNLPLHHEVQKFSSGTGSPGWSRKKGHIRLVYINITHRSTFYGMSAFICIIDPSHPTSHKLYFCYTS